MNVRPTFPRSSSFSITLAATLATCVAIGFLTAVTFLFQRDGAPFEKLAAAERACAQYVYVSDREVCVREWLAAALASNVASK